MAREKVAKGSRQPAEETSDMIEKLVYIGRVAKVVKGGRRFSFSAIIVVGDGKGRVGVGLGKANEVADARRKATEAAKKSMFKVSLREKRTLHHDVQGHFGSSRVMMRSAPPGTGIIAGGPVRAIFEALGVQDVVAKSHGTSNPHNMVKAAMVALKHLRSPRELAAMRGKKVGEIIGRRETEIADLKDSKE